MEVKTNGGMDWNNEPPKSGVVPCKSECTGSVEYYEQCMNEGVWVKSKTTGQFYPPTKIPESDVEFVVINGTMFHHIF